MGFSSSVYFEFGLEKLCSEPKICGRVQVEFSDWVSFCQVYHEWIMGCVPIELLFKWDQYFLGGRVVITSLFRALLMGLGRLGEVSRLWLLKKNMKVSISFQNSARFCKFTGHSLALKTKINIYCQYFCSKKETWQFAGLQNQYPSLSLKQSAIPFMPARYMMAVHVKSTG